MANKRTYKTDSLFRCRQCEEIGDTTDKRKVTLSNWTTRASASASLCSKCFLALMSGLKFKVEWEEWPERDSK